MTRCHINSTNIIVTGAIDHDIQTLLIGIKIVLYFEMYPIGIGLVGRKCGRREGVCNAEKVPS